MADWGPNDFIDKIAIRPRPVELPRIFNRRSTEATAPVTDERLHDAYRTMAQIVSLHGEAYLPIFARLHEEFECRKGEKSMLRIAEDVAGLRPDR
jgi:hypothetical protein